MKRPRGSNPNEAPKSFFRAIFAIAKLRFSAIGTYSFKLIYLSESVVEGCYFCPHFLYLFCKHGRRYDFCWKLSLSELIVSHWVTASNWDTASVPFEPTAMASLERRELWLSLSSSASSNPRLRRLCTMRPFLPVLYPIIFLEDSS